VQVIAQEFSLIVQDRESIFKEEYASDIVTGHFFDVVGFLRKAAHTDPLSVRHRQKTAGKTNEASITAANIHPRAVRLMLLSFFPTDIIFPREASHD